MVGREGKVGGWVDGWVGGKKSIRLATMCRSFRVSLFASSAFYFFRPQSLVLKCRHTLMSRGLLTIFVANNLMLMFQVCISSKV